MMRIADGAEVDALHGNETVRATVVVRQSNGDYLVRLADGETPTLDGPTLERMNPDAPRVPLHG
ncbi:MAG TPA: hypothetical protein VF625_14975 [Longimicrobium sp.]|jgi:hypothetical protein